MRWPWSRPVEERFTGDVRLRVRIRQPRIIASEHESRRFAVLFEDDRKGGYSYALDLAHNPEEPIVDAALLYQGVKAREIELQILWSKSLPRALLMTDGSPQVVFDFEQQRCWSRSAFPEGAGAWAGPKSWSDEALEGF